MTLRHPIRRWLTTVVVAATTVTVLAGTATAAPAVDPVPPPDAAASSTTDFTPRDLRGRWISAGCETVVPGSLYGTRDFLLRKSSRTQAVWSIDFDAFGDAGCTVPLFTTSISGDYRVLGVSAANPDAREANFQRQQVTLTLFQPALVAEAEAEGCGTGDWTVGVEQDVTERGCEGLGAESTEECPTEFDLLKLERVGDRDGAGDELFFGQRQADSTGTICDRRAPDTRDQEPVVRQGRR